MSDEALASEVERLRAEVEAYRQRELVELHTALNQAVSDRDHFRAEAQRNAEVGLRIAQEAEAERNLLMLRLAKLEGK